MSSSNYVLTPNLGLYKPVSGQDVGQWGTHWNRNADTLDALFPGGAIAFLPALGVVDGSNAAAGHIGEYISATVSTSTALTSNVNTNLTTISLTAGDWDVYGQAYFQASSGAGADDLRVWINTVSATQPTGYAGGLAIESTSSGGLVNSLVTSPLRLNITAATTVYLGVNANYGSGTMNVQGLIRARRMR